METNKVLDKLIEQCNVLIKNNEPLTPELSYQMAQIVYSIVLDEQQKIDRLSVENEKIFDRIKELDEQTVVYETTIKLLQDFIVYKGLAEELAEYVNSQEKEQEKPNLIVVK